MLRDLPVLEALLDEILAALGGGTKSVLNTGDWPIGAVAFDGHHLLLVRDHGPSVTLSLPVKESWSLRTREEWRTAQDPIRRAVAAYREKSRGAVSMADVLVALDPRRWAPNYPGTPVPTEAWIEERVNPTGRVGLFQEEQQVRAVVWVGSQMRSQSVASPSDSRALAAWIPQQLADQQKAAAAEAAEKARKKALPVPDLEAVLAALRSGKRISTGGGRYFETYFMSEGRLGRQIFDEGYEEAREITTQDLRRAIQSHPDAFREKL